MIRVAICEPDKQERLRLRNMLRHCASEVRAANVTADLFASTSPLISALTALRADYYDLVLARLDRELGNASEQADAAIPTATAQLADVLLANETTVFVAMSSEETNAVAARRLGAQGFLLLPTEYDSFRATVAEPLRRRALAATPTLLVKSRKGLDNVQTGEILFVETVKNGISIHLPGGETIPMRSTLQSLFDRIEGMGPFVKAGSSFVLNLDNVRSVGESSVIFADGEAIIVPVRARKPLKDALANYRMRA